MSGSAEHSALSVFAVFHLLAKSSGDSRFVLNNVSPVKSTVTTILFITTWKAPSVSPNCNSIVGLALLAVNVFSKNWKFPSL